MVTAVVVVIYGRRCFYKMSTTIDNIHRMLTQIIMNEFSYVPKFVNREMLAPYVIEEYLNYVFSEGEMGKVRYYETLDDATERYGTLFAEAMIGLLEPNCCELHSDKQWERAVLSYKKMEPLPRELVLEMEKLRNERWGAYLSTFTDAHRLLRQLVMDEFSFAPEFVNRSESIKSIIGGFFNHLLRYDDVEEAELYATPARRFGELLTRSMNGLLTLKNCGYEYERINSDLEMRVNEILGRTDPSPMSNELIAALSKLREVHLAMEASKRPKRFWWDMV